MKVKIKNSKALKFRREPLLFEVKTKNNGKITEGFLLVEFTKKRIIVDLERELSREERLDVLKEIFERFIYRQRVDYSIERFKLEDTCKIGRTR